jgi:lipopolysaccharide assembly outer membrane protein LptD (OstA)
MEGINKMIGVELLRYNKTQEYITLDTETESLNTVYAKPFQVSFSVWTLDGQKEFHDYFVWWENLRMSAGAAAITKFNYDEYKSKARDPKEILEIVESYLHNPKYKIAAQNFLGYDSMILNAWRRALGMKPIYDYLYQPFKTYDTIALSKAYKKQIKLDTSSSNNFLAHQYRLIDYVEKGLKTSIGIMSKEFGIAVDESRLHTADYDIIQNVEIHKKLIWLLEI